MMINKKQWIKCGQRIKNMLEYHQFKENFIKDKMYNVSLEKWSAKLELTVNELEDALESIQQFNRIYSK